MQYNVAQCIKMLDCFKPLDHLTCIIELETFDFIPESNKNLFEMES